MNTILEDIRIAKIDRAENFAAISLALLVLFTCKPWPRWFMPSGTFQLIFLLTTSYSIIKLSPIEYKRNSLYNLSVSFLVAIYAIVFNLPFFHEMRPAYLVDCIILIEVIWLPLCIIKRAYGYLRTIFFWISVFAIFTWVIHTIGFELPHYSLLHPDFRTNPLESYRIYGFSVSQLFGNKLPDSLERVNGLFAEPGHFGIYLGFMMATNKFDFSTKKDKTMLVAGLLTFSTAFYGLLAIGIIYKLMTSETWLKDFKRTLIVICLIVTCVFASDNVKKILIDRPLEGLTNASLESLTEKRVADVTLFYYGNFLRTDKIWVGMGNTDKLKVQETNWRGGIYRYGIIGIIVMSVLFVGMVSSTPKNYSFLILCMLLLIMSHRMYMATHGYLLLLVYMAVAINSEFAKITDNEEDKE